MSSPYKTFTCLTYGCKVNFADSSTISRQLINLGYSRIDNESEADIFIINTCSVTDMADKKAQKVIRKIHSKSPKSKIIVTGCYAQLKPNEIYDIPGVDYVIGTNEKLDADTYLQVLKDESKKSVSSVDNEKFNISYSTNERTRAFIKIQDGCDYNCTYCTIPNARGLSRSDSVSKTIHEIKKVLSCDIKEIVLSGVNIGDFGVKNNENLNNLLNEIEKIDNLNRYRISSIEPNLIDNEMIEIFSNSSKWVKHLHIPLQSGSNKILKKMKRRYTSKQYQMIINKIQKFFPNICIGVDVIIGFPGETESDFLLTYNFIKSLKISYLHVFSYSKRENTEANEYNNHLSMDIIKNRRVEMQKLSDIKYNAFTKQNIGSIRNVLFENHENGLLSGLTDNYLKVYVPGNVKYVNTIHKVKILDFDNIILGELFYE